MNLIEKECPNCNQTKTVSSFAKNKNRKDGLQCYCRDCQSEKSRASANTERGRQVRVVKYHNNMLNPEFRRKIAKKAFKLRAKNIFSGLCASCGKLPREGRRYCEDCIRAVCERQMKKRREWSAQGFCNRCGSADILPATKKNKWIFCETCYLRNISCVNTKTRKTGEFLKNKLVEQNFRCVYSGRLLVLGENASVDHIQPVSRFPHLANEPENLQWVDLTVNYMKRNMNHEEFLVLIKEVSSHCQIQFPTI